MLKVLFQQIVLWYTKESYNLDCFHKIEKGLIININQLIMDKKTIIFKHHNIISNRAQI